MKFKFKYTDRIVGAFVIAAVTIVGITGGLIAVNRKVFVTRYIFKTKFVDAVGISTATPIYFKGFEIGRLSGYTLNKDNMIDGEFEVYDTYRDRIVAYSALTKSSTSPFSAVTIELLQGPHADSLLPDGGYVPSLETPDGQRLRLARKVQKPSDAVSSMLANLDHLLDNLNRDHNEDQGAIFRGLVGMADATDKLNTLLSGLDNTLQKLGKDGNRNDGALFRALSNTADMTEQLNTTTERLNAALATADELLKAYKNPDGIARRLVDPSGKTFFEPLSASLTNLNTSLEELNALLKFMNAQAPDAAEVLSESKSALRESRRTMEGLNNNPFLRGGISPDVKPEIRSEKIRLRDVDPSPAPTTTPTSEPK